MMSSTYGRKLDESHHTDLEAWDGDLKYTLYRNHYPIPFVGEVAVVGAAYWNADNCTLTILDAELEQGIHLSLQHPLDGFEDKPMLTSDGFRWRYTVRTSQTLKMKVQGHIVPIKISILKEGVTEV